MEPDWEETSSINGLAVEYGIEYTTDAWFVNRTDYMLVQSNGDGTLKVRVWNGRDPRTEWVKVMALPVKEIK